MWNVDWVTAPNRKIGPQPGNTDPLPRAAVHKDTAAREEIAASKAAQAESTAGPHAAVLKDSILKGSILKGWLTMLGKHLCRRTPMLLERHLARKTRKTKASNMHRGHSIRHAGTRRRLVQGRSPGSD